MECDLLMAGPKRAELIKNPAKVKIPQCPVHNVDMIFYADVGKWLCSEDADCKITAYPKREAGKGDPVQATGELTLVKVMYGQKVNQFIIRSDNNVLVDITELVQDTLMAEVAGPYGTDVILRFRNVVESE
jgi:hypothetical protein